MRTTLKNRLQADKTNGRLGNAGGAAAVHRRDGRDPGLNLQWLAGLLAALAIAGGCVAQQHLSRTAYSDRRVAVPDQPQVASVTPASHRLFQDRLQTGYLDLAMAAYERRAFTIADFFAKRSIDAGGATAPDPIAPDFDAPADAAVARRDLVTWLVAGGVAREPETAAQAQLAVDCWLRESRPDGAFDVRAGCRRQAREMLARIGAGPSEEDAARQAALEEEGLEPARASAALAALVERWRPALDRSREAAAAIARPVAATLRRRAEAVVQVQATSPAASREERAVSRDADAAAQAGAAIEAIADGARTGAAFGVESVKDDRALAPAAELAAAKGREFALDGFGFDSASLGDATHRLIALRLAESGVEDAKAVLIEGHTDSTGPAGYNLTLSERRAEAVRVALRDALGRKAPPMEIRGYGETRLAVATADGVREPRNRRVVVRIQ